MKNKKILNIFSTVLTVIICLLLVSACETAPYEYIISGRSPSPVVTCDYEFVEKEGAYYMVFEETYDSFEVYRGFGDHMPWLEYSSVHEFAEKVKNKELSDYEKSALYYYFPPAVDGMFDKYAVQIPFVKVFVPNLPEGFSILNFVVSSSNPSFDFIKDNNKNSAGEIRYDGKGSFPKDYVEFTLENGKTIEYGLETDQFGEETRYNYYLRYYLDEENGQKMSVQLSFPNNVHLTHEIMEIVSEGEYVELDFS